MVAGNPWQPNFSYMPRRQQRTQFAEQVRPWFALLAQDTKDRALQAVLGEVSSLRGLANATQQPDHSS